MIPETLVKRLKTHIFILNILKYFCSLFNLVTTNIMYHNKHINLSCEVSFYESFLEVMQSIEDILA